MSNTKSGQGSVRNLDYIRSKDPKLYEALEDLLQHHQNLAQQVNGNSTGQPGPPPPISGLQVTANNGHFNAQIKDEGAVFRGVQYYIEHSESPNFTNPTVVHLGDSRSWDKFMGNTTRYFRAYSSYSSSPPGAPAYHGGAIPTPVVGGGIIGGPPVQESQGSGTGTPGQGLTGPGRIPFRSSTGVPPVRNS